MGSNVYGANLTKYRAGGTGDNLIAQGNIKAAEKVWVDSYTYSSAATIGSVTNLEIAAIPEGHVITGIEVYGLNDLTTTSTNTISIGVRLTSPAVTNATFFLAATTFGTAVGIGIQGYAGCLQANSNIGYTLTGGTNYITLCFAGANPSVTGGTIRTVVRYT